MTADSAAGIEKHHLSTQSSGDDGRKLCHHIVTDEHHLSGRHRVDPMMHTTELAATMIGLTI